MKKILAGVLAAASLMAMTVSASATSKNITSAGDVSYDVNATAPKVVLKLTMPAKLEASLNPFGADIKLTKATDAPTTDAGIASVAYDVVNKSLDYGVYIGATAITKVVTTDKTAWKVEKKAPTTGTKGAQMALVAVADADALKAAAGTIPTASKAFDGTDGAIVMDSTVAANASTGVAAGETSQAKFAYVKAATETEAEQKIVLGFVGALADGNDSKPVEWTTDDSINVNLVLKVTAGPKDAFAAAP